MSVDDTRETERLEQPEPTWSPAPEDTAAAPPGADPVVPPPPPPDAPPPGGSRWDWRRIVGLVGRTLIASGVLVLLFVVYQLWGTAIQEARAQSDLSSQFDKELASTTTLAATTTTIAPSTTAGPTTTIAPTTTLPAGPTTLAPPPDVKEGDPLARIQIPRIGVDKIVVAGVSVADLKKGPGHYPNTPLPGQLGNAAIAGHRTTYGAPFFRVDELSIGDDIIVTTVQGTFRYKVTSQKIVSPNDFSVLDPTPDATLTLTSCNPRYSASQRIIIKAKLDLAASSKPAAPSAPYIEPKSASVDTAAPDVASSGAGDSNDVAVVTRPPATASISRAAAADTFSDGWFSDPAAWFPTILWGLLCIAVAVGSWLVGRRWRKWPSYFLAVLPFLFVLYFFFENVSRLLPPNI